MIDRVMAGVCLSLLLGCWLLFSEFEKQAVEIADLKYDLSSWEQAGEFWEKRNSVFEKITLEREKRTRALNAETNILKQKLKEVSHEVDPCLKSVVSDDELNILWDDKATAAAQLYKTDGNNDRSNP